MLELVQIPHWKASIKLQWFDNPNQISIHGHAWNIHLATLRPLWQLPASKHPWTCRQMLDLSIRTSGLCSPLYRWFAILWQTGYQRRRRFPESKYKFEEFCFSWGHRSSRIHWLGNRKQLLQLTSWRNNRVWSDLVSCWNCKIGKPHLYFFNNLILLSYTDNSQNSECVILQRGNGRTSGY